MEKQTMSSRQGQSFPFCLACFQPSESALMTAIWLFWLSEHFIINYSECMTKKFFNLINQLIYLHASEHARGVYNVP